MNAAGIVVEYNPFHNGHLYHINETKQLSNAEVIVAVMSGSFLQRGEPAVTDKWTRTKMALQHGVDIVVELPYAFSTQKAETFATGAIHILNYLKCQFFCFGSENGQIAPFLHAAERLKQQNNEFSRLVRSFMKEGVSYPSAQTKARDSIFQKNPLPLDLSKPNNILGLHYVQANNELGSPMTPLTILRKGAGFHDTEAKGSIASATAIRKQLIEKSGSIDHAVPPLSAAALKKQFLHSWELYWPLLRYRLLTIEPGQLASIYEIEEGIEPRLIKAALQSDSFAEFMQRVKTKRYTWTRLQRMMTHILTDTDKESMEQGANVSFIRLLGMTEAGRAYIRSVKKDIQVPLISRTASGSSLLSLDLKASRVFASAPRLPGEYAHSLLKQEYSTPPILL
ncbi:nucleotidyltransferase [Domibacillus indicus]|uniref:nucleotidyltransferase n=1 Tax=Domibacillus indicus TaxID=1437523 RepID=UPI000617D0DB|nr:nucleotidyltransferase [Domibacillus indicus]